MVDGVTYRRLSKLSWKTIYRSLDDGQTWHKSSIDAFKQAKSDGALEIMSARDIEFLTQGGMILE